MSGPPICRSPVWDVGRKDAFFATFRAGIAVTRGHRQQACWGRNVRVRSTLDTQGKGNGRPQQADRTTITT